MHPDVTYVADHNGVAPFEVSAEAVQTACLAHKGHRPNTAEFVKRRCLEGMVLPDATGQAVRHHFWP